MPLRNNSCVCAYQSGMTVHYYHLHVLLGVWPVATKQLIVNLIKILSMIASRNLLLLPYGHVLNLSFELYKQ